MNEILSKLKSNGILVLLVLLLVVGGIGSWLIIQQADRKMRADFLEQGRLITQAFDIEQVKRLTGTDADLDLPQYQHIKQLFGSIRSIDSKYSFLYLAGRNPDGSINFLVDSEPVDSPDYSPPGMIYTESSEGIQRVFDTKEAFLEGLASDRRGTWVSALTPLIDPASGEVVAVAGVDISSAAWTLDVASQASIPLALMLILFIALITAYSVTRREKIKTRSILLRLLLPLGGMLILLLAGIGALFWLQQQQWQNERIDSEVAGINIDLNRALEQQSAALSMLIQPIISKSEVGVDLRDGNTAHLLSEWRPTYETLKKEYNITHFYFLDAKRVCLLRVHDPERNGDRIDRFTVREAERTGKISSGIELGALGTFTLRAVQPVYMDGGLVGYVEIGKEIDDILTSLHPPHDIETALLIRKEVLDRTLWEKGMRLSGRTPDWDRLPYSVVTFSSKNNMEDIYAKWTAHVAGEPTHKEAKQEITNEGKTWLVSSMPVFDASKKEVGDLLAMVDIGPGRAAFFNRVMLGGSAACVLLALLVGFTYTLLKKTDQLIQSQQLKLEESGKQFRNMFLDHSAVMFLIEPISGNILAANSSASQFYGYSVDELTSMSINEINTLSADEAIIIRNQALHRENNYFLYQHKLASGEIRDVESYSTPIESGGETVLFSIVHDVTERRRSETALKNSLCLIEATLESIDNGILVIANDGSILKINSKFADMWRIPKETVQSMDAADLLKMVTDQITDPDAYTAKVNAVNSNPLEESFDVIEFKDGRIFERTTKPMFVSGEPQGRVRSFLDITARMQMEEALRESQQVYRELVEQVPEVIYTDEIRGGWHYIGPNIEDLCGYSAGELTADPGLWNRITNAEDKARLDAEIQSLSVGDVLNTEYRIKTRPGNTIWVRDHGVVKKDETTGKNLIQGLLAEITKQKETEMALQKSEERFKQLAEVFPETIFEADLVGDVTYTNAHGYECFASSAEEFSHGINLLNLVAPEERLIVQLRLQERIQGITGGFLEYKALRKNGQVFDAMAYSSPIYTEGKVTGIRGFILDISERKRVEEALAESEANFRTFFETIHDMILVATPDGKILYGNETLKRKLGYDADDLSVMHVLDLNPADRFHEAEDIFAAMLRGERDHCPLPLAAKNGSLIPVETRVWFGIWNGEKCIFWVLKRPHRGTGS